MHESRSSGPIRPAYTGCAPVAHGPTGSKEDLALQIAKALVKYEARPSSALWIEIQACARAILH